MISPVPSTDTVLKPSTLNISTEAPASLPAYGLARQQEWIADKDAGASVKMRMAALEPARRALAEPSSPPSSPPLSSLFAKRDKGSDKGSDKGVDNGAEGSAQPSSPPSSRPSSPPLSGLFAKRDKGSDKGSDKGAEGFAQPSSPPSSRPLSGLFAKRDKGSDKGGDESFRSRRRLRRLRLGTLGFFVSLLSVSLAAAGLTDRLVLHLPLAQDLEDHSPLRRPIHIVGAVRIEPEGAWFGGRRDWIEAPHIGLNDRPFAVAMWIKESGQARHVGLVEQFDLARPGHHLHLMLRENRQPYFGLLLRDQISPVGVPWEQEWMHIVFQHTGQFQQIWINGRLLASFRAEPYQGLSGVTAIGKAPRWSNVPARDFVGHMRDVRIYHRHLEPAEIGLLSSSPFRDTSPEQRPVVTEDSEPSPGTKPIPLAPALAAILPDDPARPFLEIDGQQVTVNGRPGTIYVLETSTDMQVWTPLAQGGSETGTIAYLHPDPDAPMRFYRVRVEELGGRDETRQ